MTSTEQTNEPKTCSLYAIAHNETTLKDSLNACQSVWDMEGAIALLYSPRSCQFARLMKDGSQSVLMNPENQVIGLSDVFEVRVFSDEAELRWLNQANGTGRAVLLSEVEKTLDNYEPVKTLMDLETLPQTYLLWGAGWIKPDAWGDEWSRLTLARIGSLPVLIFGVERQQSVRLKVREYLKSDDYGNMSVVEERLLGLEKQKS